MDVLFELLVILAIKAVEMKMQMVTFKLCNAATEPCSLVSTANFVQAILGAIDF